MPTRRFGRGLDHAFGAVDGVRRTHRHEGRPPAIVGVLLLGLGVLFLLDNLNLIEATGFIRTFWPLLVIAWGGARLLSGRGGERVVGALAVFFGGILLGNRLFDWDINVVSVFWPLILIALGLSILTRTGGRRRGKGAPPPGVAGADGPAAETTEPGREDVSSTVTEFVVMGGVERRNVSQAFQGGNVTAVMGSVDLDLRECRMAPGEVRVTVLVVLGEVSLRIPREWMVESRLAPVLASLDDRSEPPVGPSPPRLVIEGSALLGNVEIRN